MSKLFIIPKIDECTELFAGTRRDHISNEETIVLNPNKLISYFAPKRVAEDRTAQNITSKIQEYYDDNITVCSILYHIGSMCDINQNLKKSLPDCFPLMYSVATIGYEDLLSLIRNVEKNNPYDVIMNRYFFNPILEAKLNLLHNCFCQNTNLKEDDKAALLNLLPDGDEKNSFRKALDAYTSNDIHFLNLIKLRDTLLPD